MTAAISMLVAMIATVGGSDAAPHDFWFPAQGSTVAPAIDAIFHFITYLCYFFFVGIVGVMMYFVFKYKKPKGTPSESSPSHNTPLEVTWTIIPLILVIAIFYVGMKGYMDLRRAPAEAYEVSVTAQKWSWQFKHTNGCEQYGTLYVPAGRPVRLTMRSMDVLHALFIPAFRVKQDIVPGRVTTLWFEAVKPGEYDLFCAEYCGKDHSRMAARVHVLSEAEFETKLAECADFLDKYTDEDLDQAGAIYYKRLCASCHTLDGTTSTGPSWDTVWEKTVNGETVFDDGSTLQDYFDNDTYNPGTDDAVGKATAYLEESMSLPSARVVMNFKAGAMPTFKDLKPRAREALIHFMRELDKYDVKGNLLDAGGN